MAWPTSGGTCSRRWIRKREPGIRTRAATTGRSWSSSQRFKIRASDSHNLTEARPRALFSLGRLAPHRYQRDRDDAQRAALAARREAQGAAAEIIEFLPRL